jgi:hypothetical protein
MFISLDKDKDKDKDKEIWMLTKTYVNILIVASAVALISCGKDGSKKITTTPSQATVPLSIISTAQAVSPVPIPNITEPQVDIPVVKNAVLRHVYSESIEGILSPTADFINSPNAVVERHIALGFYSEVTAEPDNSYIIEPEDNDLAYFRVTNTRPSGRVRVHNFYGVPVGHYMTRDTTDIDHKNKIASSCRDVAVRLNNLPSQINATAQLMINGQVINDAVYNNNQAYKAHVNLCAISSENDYLLVVAYENEQRDIDYGFQYYKNLADEDLLEIALEHKAEIIEWSSDHLMNDNFTLRGDKSNWRAQVGLYHSYLQSGMNGYLPKFSMLTLDKYHFNGSYGASDGGINFVKREFAADTIDIAFDINQMQLEGIDLTPYRISWQSLGQDSERIVSGVIFDQSLTQTYAFLSMDPDVLLDKELNFPLDNIELLIDSTVSSLVAAASAEEKQRHFVSSAAIFSGFLYWPNTSGDAANNELNSDAFISGDGSVLLELLIKNLGD